MSTIKTSERAEFEKIASMTGWAIAEHFGCSYNGDGDPINHGGFFYDPRDWAEHGYAKAVEFWWDHEHGRMVVQRGTIHKPDTPEQWESVWGCIGAYEGEQRENIHAQIDASESGMGMEPDGTRYPDLKEYNLKTWKEWHIWRSVAEWLRELGK
jgi:hypothetical protein